ncbi:MAG: hypothetical protein HPY53_00240 [Brevinematales bacterium]|nr:hypothetical protein [Brevinematales bacterium]
MIFLLISSCSNQSIVKKSEDSANIIIDKIKWYVLPNDGVIAVANFVSYNNKEIAIIAMDFSEKLVNMLRQKGFTVVENAQLNVLVKEQKLALSGVVDSKKLEKIGQMIGADYVLLGTVSEINGEISINARLVDIYTREIITSVSTSFFLEEEQNANVSYQKPSVSYNDSSHLFWYSYVNIILNLNSLPGGSWEGEFLDLNLIISKKFGFGLSLLRFIHIQNVTSYPVLRILLPLYTYPSYKTRKDVYLEVEAGLLQTPYLDLNASYRTKLQWGYMNMPVYISLGFKYYLSKFDFQDLYYVYLEGSIGFGDYLEIDSIQDFFGFR